MLDSFVIDQVGRRDRRERDERERPVRRSDEDGREEKPKRGVVVIDLRHFH